MIVIALLSCFCNSLYSLFLKYQVFCSEHMLKYTFSILLYIPLFQCFYLGICIQFFALIAFSPYLLLLMPKGCGGTSFVHDTSPGSFCFTADKKQASRGPTHKNVSERLPVDLPFRDTLTDFVKGPDAAEGFMN